MKTLLLTEPRREEDRWGLCAVYAFLNASTRYWNAKQCAQGYLQDAGNTVITLETCAYKVHHYTSKMQSDTRIANRPLPQQRQVKTATHKMQDDQVVVSTVRSSRGVSIFCQRLDGAEPNNGKAMKLCQTMTSLEVTVTTRRNGVCARINIRSTQESRRDRN